MFLSIQYLDKYGQDITINDVLDKNIIEIQIDIFKEDSEYHDWTYIVIEGYEVTRICKCGHDVHKLPSLRQVLNFLYKEHEVELDKL